MTFGEYLKECIDKRDTPKTRITAMTGINRGKLYSIFDGKRRITEDELFAMIDNAGFSRCENEKLLDLYFEELYGKSEFSKIKFLEKAIVQNNYESEPCEYDASGNNISSVIENEEQLLNTIAYMFYHDKDIISNFSYSDKEIDSVVFDCVLKSNTKLTHIVDLAIDEEGEENFESVFASLKYVFNICFPVCRYININQMKYNNMFPYFFVGKGYAILYKDRSGIFVSNKATVESIRKNASKIVKSSFSPATKPKDILAVKSIIGKLSKNANDAIITVGFYPCISKYVDYDFMYSITKDEIPMKKMLVNIAYEHYSKLYQNRRVCNITSPKGIEFFAETGHVKEITPDFINPADKENRIKVLEELKNAVNNDELYIFDDDKMDISSEFEITHSNKKLIILSNYDNNKEVLATGCHYLVSFDDQSMINSFIKLTEFLIHSKKVYPKEYAIRFIEGLIVKLKHMNEE